jgi:hypothetical protein
MAIRSATETEVMVRLQGLIVVSAAKEGCERSEAASGTEGGSGHVSCAWHGGFVCFSNLEELEKQGPSNSRMGKVAGGRCRRLCVSP